MPVVAGKITHSIGWQRTFYLLAILCGIALPVTFFLVPETAYRLPDGLITDFDSAAEKMAFSDLSSDKADHVSEEQNRSLVAKESQSS